MTAAPNAVEEQGRIEHLAELGAVDTDAQEHRREREEAGESPHDTLQAADGDAEE